MVKMRSLKRAPKIWSIDLQNYNDDDDGDDDGGDDGDFDDGGKDEVVGEAPKV